MQCWGEAKALTNMTPSLDSLKSALSKSYTRLNALQTRISQRRDDASRVGKEISAERSD
ncbi:hypothetical protein DCAR_0209075 [Daucus carota subsp. sativus]|uniref:Uncharacterized protein n=1 Tax=Daucus carota subsp. sativus TaxID=79200 RepID=A0A166F0D5_DAUCS|nr:hypothetical protein DCAR_0209075 [Daucus carota subsp. sativus]